MSDQIGWTKSLLLLEQSVIVEQYLALLTLGLLSSFGTFCVTFCLISSSSFLILILHCPTHLPVCASVICPSPWSSGGSSYVWNSSSPGNLEIMSPDDWHSLKQLASCSCKTGVSLYLVRSPPLLSLLHTPHTRRHSSNHLLFLPASPPSLSHTSSASIPFFACELKAVTPYRRGFFCGDSSITYPDLDRDSIPDSLLIAGGIAITGLTVRQ